MESGPDDINWGYVIVHRDLKPANSKFSNPTCLGEVRHSITWTVFLGLEDENSGFPLYPVAKTGDWGLARKVKHDDHRNPIGLRGAGTESYYAPVSIPENQIGKSLNLVKGAKSSPFRR